MSNRLPLAAIALAAALCAGQSHAQGIPVIDIANLIQTIQQVMNDITKIENQVAADRRSCRPRLRASTACATSATSSTARRCKTTFPPTPTPSSTPSTPPATRALTSDGQGAARRRHGLQLSRPRRRGAGPPARRRSPSRTSKRACCRTRCARHRVAWHRSTRSWRRSTPRPTRRRCWRSRPASAPRTPCSPTRCRRCRCCSGMADSEERIARSRDRERQYQMLGPHRPDLRLPAAEETSHEHRARPSGAAAWPEQTRAVLRGQSRLGTRPRR